jgi:hypothetical protein
LIVAKKEIRQGERQGRTLEMQAQQQLFTTISFFWCVMMMMIYEKKMVTVIFPS